MAKSSTLSKVNDGYQNPNDHRYSQYNETNQENMRRHTWRQRTNNLNKTFFLDLLAGKIVAILSKEGDHFVGIFLLCELHCVLLLLHSPDCWVNPKERKKLTNPP